MREDGDVAEVWDESPRPRQCPGCQERDRQLLALQTELRWAIDARNAMTAEVKRLAVLLELGQYDRTSEPGKRATPEKGGPWFHGYPESHGIFLEGPPLHPKALIEAVEITNPSVYPSDRSSVQSESASAQPLGSAIALCQKW